MYTIYIHSHTDAMGANVFTFLPVEKTPETITKQKSLSLAVRRSCCRSKHTAVLACQDLPPDCHYWSQWLTDPPATPRLTSVPAETVDPRTLGALHSGRAPLCRAPWGGRAGGRDAPEGGTTCACGSGLEGTSSAGACGPCCAPGGRGACGGCPCLAGGYACEGACPAWGPGAGSWTGAQGSPADCRPSSQGTWRRMAWCRWPSRRKASLSQRGAGRTLEDRNHKRFN